MTARLLSRLVIAVSAAAAVPAGASGDAPAGLTAPDPLDHGTFSLYVENDLFAGTDRHYTNGTRLAWTTPALAKFSDNPFTGPLSQTLDDIPYINRPGYQRNVSFVLGQVMFTPEDIHSSSLVVDDRPYAGWLYTGIGLIWKNARSRHSLSLEIGVVGPWALAHETQDFVHDLTGADKAQGWDHQLENEFGAVLAYERIWRFPLQTSRSGFDWEVLPFAGAMAGNINISAKAGAELRAGWNLPDDFGTATIDSTATTSTPMEGAQRARRSGFADVGAHVFVRGEGRAVAHNIFLDGNTFADSHSVDREPLVGEVSAGISFNYRDIKLTYAYAWQTREFRGQEEGQTFGSITLNIPF